MYFIVQINGQDLLGNAYPYALSKGIRTNTRAAGTRFFYLCAYPYLHSLFVKLLRRYEH